MNYLTEMKAIHMRINKKLLDKIDSKASEISKSTGLAYSRSALIRKILEDNIEEFNFFE